jgi:hypothetical protein
MSPSRPVTGVAFGRASLDQADFLLCELGDFGLEGVARAKGHHVGKQGFAGVAGGLELK